MKKDKTGGESHEIPEKTVKAGKTVSKKHKILGKVFGIAGCVIGVLVLTVAVYLIYVFASYHRVGDMKLEAVNRSDMVYETGKEYKLVSYNIGFGAYLSDFGFFMDGGSNGRAYSKESVIKDMKDIAELLVGENADIYNIQEIDEYATRSYHVDERVFLEDALPNHSYVYAENWDSPFLWLPLIKPHGAAKTGIMILAKGELRDSERVELPVETGVMKIIDLDRCYQKSRLAAADGKDIVLYNFHLSAYSSDGSVSVAQLRKLLDDFNSEYAKGNYCIAAGDFNKDILGDSSLYFGKPDKVYTWAQPIPDGILNDELHTLIAPIDTDHPVATSRNADGPYHERQFQVTIDGFLISKNVTCVSSAVIDTGFAYSDHNPITMTFVLN